MASALDEEEIGKILETYAETESITETAQIVSRNKNTVQKYVNKARQMGDERIPAEEHETDNSLEQQYEEFEMGSSPFVHGADEEEAEAYGGMTPGGFLLHFFEDFEVGVKKKWVRIQARRADRREKLPTKESIVADLLGMNSGVNKSSHVEANYIADEYWAEAQTFLQTTGYQAAHLSEAAGRTKPGGQSQTGMQGGMSYGNEFVGPGTQAGMGGGVGQQGDSMSMLLHELRQLRQEVKQPSGQQAQQSEGNETLERLKDLREEKKILEELSGGDERLQQIENQIMALQQQMQQGGEAGGQAPLPSSGTLEDRLLELAASNPEVPMRDVLDYLDDRSEAEEHPDVLEKKYEKEMKEVELEHQTDRAERIASTIENVADRVGEGIGRQIVGGGSFEEETPSETPAASDGGHRGGAETQRDGQSNEMDVSMDGASEGGAEPAMADLGECPHCGTPMERSPGGQYCQECQYGVGTCDLCSFPIEIPPIGDAGFGRCAACENVVEAPDDDEASVECDTCGWEGTGEELRGELTECGNCEEIRPIRRQVDETEMMDRLESISGA